MVQSAIPSPAMTLPEFFREYRLSKASYYKLPPHQRPTVRRIGTKPIILREDAEKWAANLPTESTISHRQSK